MAAAMVSRSPLADVSSTRMQGLDSAKNRQNCKLYSILRPKHPLTSLSANIHQKIKAHLKQQTKTTCSPKSALKKHILLSTTKHKHLFDITTLASPLKRARAPERTYDDDDLESNSDSDCIDPAMWSPKRGCNNFQKAILLKKSLKTPRSTNLRLERLGLKTPAGGKENGESGLANEVERPESPVPIVIDRVSPSTIAVMDAAIHRREMHMRASGRLAAQDDTEMADASPMALKLSQQSPQILHGIQAEFKAMRRNTAFTILEQTDTDTALQIMQQEASLVKVTTQNILNSCDAIAVEYEEDKENTPPEGHGFSRQHVATDALVAKQIKLARRQAVKIGGGERAAMGNLELKKEDSGSGERNWALFTSVKDKETRAVMYAAAKKVAGSFGFCIDEEEL